MSEFEKNAEHLPEIERDIASVLVFSSDGRLLMGRKDPTKGGVYPDAWHIPGGGLESEDEGSLEKAAIREAKQEAGLELELQQLAPVPIVGEGETVKTLKDGSRVWCRMRFNRFEVHLEKTAKELELEARPGDDLVELRWFSPEELKEVPQIPGGKEFFIQAGYIAED